MKTQRTLMYLVLGLASLTCSLACCHGEGVRSDSLLVKADSLLRHNNPDSALQLLTAIGDSNMTNAGNRAYHALLITEAQYRCYADITSDSTINVALEYYQRNALEREKLVRTYIYTRCCDRGTGQSRRGHGILQTSMQRCNA